MFTEKGTEMSPDEIRKEYEINKDFHQWFDAYIAHNNISFDRLLEDPIVIYSVQCWRDEREKLAKG